MNYIQIAKSYLYENKTTKLIIAFKILVLRKTFFLVNRRPEMIDIHNEYISLMTCPDLLIVDRMTRLLLFFWLTSEECALMIYLILAFVCRL